VHGAIVMPTKCVFLSSFEDEKLQLKDALRVSLSPYDLDLIHASDLSTAIPLPTRISNAIEGADIVIADMSKSNVNILFEVGYAIGRGLPVVLLAPEGAYIPAHLASSKVILLREEDRPSEDLVEQVQAALGAVIALRKKRDAEPLPQKALSNPSRDPFVELRAEGLESDRLSSLFVTPSHFHAVAGQLTVVIEGQRGTGKTTLLRMMAAQNALQRQNSVVAGFYLNFNQVTHFWGSQRSVLSSPDQFVAYINLLYLGVVVDDLVRLKDSGGLSRNEEKSLLSGLVSILPLSPQSPSSVGKFSAALTNVIYTMRSTALLENDGSLPVETLRRLSAPSFLDELAGDLQRKIKVFSNVWPTYLLDDYATDWLGEDIVTAANQVLFQNSRHCCFKIATIPGRQPFALRTERPSECHDYLLVGIGLEGAEIHKSETTEFARSVIDLRLRSAGWTIDANSMLDTEIGLRHKEKVRYRGLGCLASLCANNCRSLLYLCGRMVQENGGGDRPIPGAVQDKVIRDESKRFLESLHQTTPNSEYAIAFVNTTMRFFKGQARGSAQLQEAKIHPPVYCGIEIQDISKLSQAASDKLLSLMRSGVLRQAFTKLASPEKRHFVLTGMFFPAFGLPTSGQRRFIRLTSKEASAMLLDPHAFWEQKHLSSAITKE
jgi:hypothetical protein